MVLDQGISCINNEQEQVCYRQASFESLEASAFVKRIKKTNINQLEYD